ncbi:MAG TPA: HNH endonuclease [Blastocatellia bacterium]|nr:HNH endonuclease [Blastocatellia bacterium]
MIKVENIKINQLSSLPFKSRFDLPNSSGLYFALNTSGEPLYIGQSSEIRTRVRAHCRKGFFSSDVISVAWLIIEDKPARIALEKECVTKFKPALNTTWLRKPNGSLSFYPVFTKEELDSEIWKPLAGYEIYYEISSLGMVRRVKSQSGATVGRMLRWRLDHDRYVEVCISTDGKSVTRKVHSLVARTFLGDRPSGMTINHIDGCKSNNSVTNLEYCTMEENREHALRSGLFCTGERSHRRLHPERYPKGDSHYARTHPEKLRRGESHSRAKLSESDVRDIRAKTLSIRLSAIKYGISTTHVKRIRRMEGWQHV